MGTGGAREGCRGSPSPHEAMVGLACPHLSFRTCQFILGSASSMSLRRLVFLLALAMTVLGSFWLMDSRLWENSMLKLELLSRPDAFGGPEKRGSCSSALPTRLSFPEKGLWGRTLAPRRPGPNRSSTAGWNGRPWPGHPASQALSRLLCELEMRPAPTRWGCFSEF